MASSGAESPRRRIVRRTPGSRALIQDLLYKGGSLVGALIDLLCKGVSPMGALQDLLCKGDSFTFTFTLHLGHLADALIQSALQ